MRWAGSSLKHRNISLGTKQIHVKSRGYVQENARGGDGAPGHVVQMLTTERGAVSSALKLFFYKSPHSLVGSLLLQNIHRVQQALARLHL